MTERLTVTASPPSHKNMADVAVLIISCKLIFVRNNVLYIMEQTTPAAINSPKLIISSFRKDLLDRLRA